MNKFTSKVAMLVLTMIAVGCGEGYQSKRSNNQSNDSLQPAPVQQISQTEKAALDVFQNRCASCHASPNNIGGFNSANDLNQMIAEGRAIPGNLNDSRVYLRVANGTMPPASPISNQEVLAIRNWILSAQ